jgi:HK97 family phage portal protein
MKSAATAGDFEEVVDAHPVLELMRKANQYEDGFSQSVMRMLYMELCGNAYLHVIMDKALGVPSELFTVPAQNVTILPGKTELVEAYLYGVDRNAMQRFELDEIIHFKRPNPRNLYYGLGKVEAAYGAIQQSQAAHIQDLSFLENMSRPDYAAIVKGGASEASMRRFEESMRSLHQGTRKSGRMVTISGDIQLMPLNFPSKDLTGRDDIVEEISACFGVPVSMLKANDPNLASAQAGYSMWRETTIAPICRMDEETLNSRLLPMFNIHEDAYLAYDNPVPENRVADSAERSVAVAGGWRTPNEARLEEGYEALETPHADMLHVNGLPLGGVAPVSPFGAPAPLPAYAAPAPAPAPVDEPAQLPPTAEVEQPAAKALSVDDTLSQEVTREQKMTNARIKIAAMEAKAWDAVQQQPKFDALQAELDAMKERTASLDEIVTMLTEALGDEA